jgi:hypothetical protein
MKKQKKLKQLSLSKETIAKLNTFQLGSVKGGMPTSKSGATAESNSSSVGTSYEKCYTAICFP